MGFNGGVGNKPSNLIKWNIYASEFIEMPPTHSKSGKCNPLVRIIVNSVGESPYWGYALAPVWKEKGGCVSRNERRRRHNVSDRLRDKLITEGKKAGRVNVKVIGVPREDIVGPYMLLATDEELTIPLEEIVDSFPKIRFKLNTPLPNFTGDRVFYAKYCGGGNIIVDFSENQKLGILKVTELPHPIGRSGRIEYLDRRRDAEITLQIMDSLKPEDDIIVRLVGGYGGKMVFEPVITFLSSDNIIAPDGNRIITRIYADHIFNMPIVPPYIPLGEDNVFAGGHVPFFDGRFVDYRRVEVKGVANKGNYMPLLEVIPAEKQVDFLTAKIVT